jgi:IclR family mhp operon transcriptional activator
MAVLLGHRSNRLREAEVLRTSAIVIWRSIFLICRSRHQWSNLARVRALAAGTTLVSAIGRAWLAWCKDEEREATLALLRNRPDDIGKLANDDVYVRRILKETRKRGYAMNRGEWLSEASVTAIGRPILRGRFAIGAINLVMQNNVVTDRVIGRRYAPLLAALGKEISDAVTKSERVGSK